MLRVTEFAFTSRFTDFANTYRFPPRSLKASLCAILAARVMPRLDRLDRTVRSFDIRADVRVS